MEKKRDVYAVYFMKLVDSAWIPHTEAMQKDIFRRSESGFFKDPKSYINIKTSVDSENNNTDPINIQKFKNKEEFMEFMSQVAVDMWDEYEGKKQFDKESLSILKDIDDNKKAEDDNSIFVDDQDDYAKDFYNYEPLDFENASDSDIANRVKEIKNRNAGSWEHYMVMREVYGVDLIREPDIATKEDAERIREQRPSATENRGILRRVEVIK